MSLSKPFKAVIFVGENRRRVQRSFATQGEFDAFMLGAKAGHKRRRKKQQLDDGFVQCPHCGGTGEILDMVG